MKIDKHKALFATLIFSLLIIGVFIVRYFMGAFLPYNTENQEIKENANELRQLKEEVDLIKEQNALLSIQVSESSAKYEKIVGDIVDKYKKISIEKDSITSFADLESRFEIYKRYIDKKLEKMENISHVLHEFSKNYPEGKLYADRVSSIEKELKGRFAYLSKSNANLNATVNDRLEMWEKTFDVYTLILSAIITALIGIVGFIIYSVSKG
ncbi:MAG: hypothetical protein MJA29_01010 [Candidatus Omnitrophica bacterium]|nr:hypothetical protein [Candidatus Omnitrophota bacterium]